MTRTTIKIAKTEDAALIAELGRETFYDAFAGNPLMPQDDLKLYIESAFTISQVASELRKPNALFLIAEIDGEAAAYAKLEFGVSAECVTGKNPVKLKRIYSKRKFIGSGVGSHLLKHCLKESETRKHDKIWLTVWKHNEIAQSFYRKFQFEECGTIEFQLGTTTFLDKVLQRPLVFENSEAFGTPRVEQRFDLLLD